MSPESPLPATNELCLAISLPLRDPAGLDDLLRQLYDPAGTNFHKFLLPSELTARFGPTMQDYQAVRQFAESNGLVVTATYPNQMVLDIKGRVADIESAFQIKMNVYRHPVEPRNFYAPDSEPSVPAGLNVTSVEGLTDFSRPRHSSLKRQVAASRPLNFSGTGPNNEYAGYDFRNAYVPGTSLNGAGQTVALLEYSDYFKIDITNYENYVGNTVGLTNYVPLANVVVGGITPNTSANDEVSLDIEMAVAMAPKLSQVLVYEENSADSSVLSRIQSDNLARQVSSSWTVGNWSSSLATSWDNILKLMAAQGQSYFQSAGDSDAYTGAQPLDSGITVPADSPYATIVGGTTLNMTSPGVAWSSETVWNYNNNGIPNEGSGGGVSTFYALPSWQTDISMAANGVSASFRNIPDVSLTADDIFVCYNDGDNTGSSYFMGTSAAAPLWAGFTALVNQQGQSGGLSPVGFVNPALYALATNANYSVLFHDITTGNNIGTNTPGLYNAVAGYDLCTGLGTPNGANLINALAPVVFVPAITNAGWVLLAESATPANGGIDPGETVTVGFSLQNKGGAPTANLVATLLPSSNILEPSGPQSYGALASFGGTTNKPFTFTASGACGGMITATLQLQDGTNNLGAVNFNLLLGELSTVQTFAQNFDSVTAPALPSGWSVAHLSGTSSNWVTTTSSSDTAPNSAFIGDVGSTSENGLVSPVIAVSSSGAQLSFRQNFSFDYHSGSSRPYRDGGILQIQINSGGFTDIVTAGGSFVAGGYNGSISTTVNPLGTVSAWIHTSSGWQTVTLNLPPSAAGQNIQLRWVEGTDSSNTGTGAVGWNVDSISINENVTNCLSVFTDLAIGQSLSPASLQSGQNLVYTLSVTNLGPQSAANMAVTDTIPANATFISAPGGSYSGSQVVYTVPMIAANTTTNFTLTLAPASGNVFTNVASVATVTPESGATNTSTTLVSTQSAGSAPTITIPPVAQTIQCGSNASFTVAASGAFPLSYQWSLDNIPVSAATNTSFSLTNVHLPSHTVAVVITNSLGSATSSVPLTVQDTLPPVITIRGANPILMQFGATYVELGATASDLCAGTVPVTISGVVNTNAVSTNTVTYTATDGNGNTNTATRTVFVVDTKPPTILWSFTNLVLAANSNCVAAMPNVTGTNFIQATDLSGVAAITQNPTNNSVLPLGTNIVVIAVSDPYTNTAYSTNQIIVRDQTPPIITLNGLNPMTNELGMAFVDPGATASDSCSGVARFTTNGVVNINSVGTNLLTYMAVDGSGNTNVVTRTVFVLDTTPPTILWSFTNLVLAANSNCVAPMPNVTGTNFIQATDLSGVALVVQSPTNNASLPIGTNAVVISVADPYGNTAYSTNQIVVQDQTPPAIVLNGFSLMTNQLGVAFVDPGASVSDVCSGVALFTTNGVVNVSAVGTNILTYMAVDNSGNSNAVSRTVLVVDTLPPTIVWSFTNLVLAVNSNCVAQMPDVTGTNYIIATDLSGVAVISQAPTNNTPLPLGTNFIVIAATDTYGNTAYSTNSIVVQDQTPPQILIEPQSQTNSAGANASFNVAATACTPVTYQWYFNNAPVTAQTNNTLVVSNLSSSAIGDYSVVISASGGSVTSAVVTLTIYIPPGISGVVVNPDGTVALNLTGLPGDTYILENTTNITFPVNWLYLATNTLGTNGVWNFTDLQATNFLQQFYRLMLAP